ncbi:helix-turn-helix domain-containing protein [Photorhabdus luminescens]|uniref:DNA-binding protein n=1 Tax=Photorhabdus luminescens subsp. mexicana TaxID=2100167 RepID=A0A4R4J6F7_PHOLU|nr:helix-turn-helix domain-containing protein [Photorhabdus luminescens]TDB49208.1 DNA-binding protein [Photorhabdus luminescens subsp. mexicana]
MIQQDWHPTDIIAGLKKKGITLAALSRSSGLASSTLANALTCLERIISNALEIAPKIIWPSGY